MDRVRAAQRPCGLVRPATNRNRCGKAPVMIVGCRRIRARRFHESELAARCCPEVVIRSRISLGCSEAWPLDDSSHRSQTGCGPTHPSTRLSEDDIGENGVLTPAFGARSRLLHACTNARRVGRGRGVHGCRSSLIHHVDLLKGPVRGASDQCGRRLPRRHIIVLEERVPSLQQPHGHDQARGTSTYGAHGTGLFTINTPFVHAAHDDHLDHLLRAEDVLGHGGRSDMHGVMRIQAVGKTFNAPNLRISSSGSHHDCYAIEV